MGGWPQEWWAVCVLETLVFSARSAVWPACLPLMAGLGHGGVAFSAVFGFPGWGELGALGWMQVTDWERPNLGLHHFQAHHFPSLGAAAFSGFSVLRIGPEAGKGPSRGLALHVAIAAGQGTPLSLPMSRDIQLLTTLLAASRVQCFFRPLPVLVVLPGPSLQLACRSVGVCRG